MTNEQAWKIYSLFPNYAEAGAFGMGDEWQDAEDQIHVADYDAVA